MRPLNNICALGHCTAEQAHSRSSFTKRILVSVLARREAQYCYRQVFFISLFIYLFRTFFLQLTTPRPIELETPFKHQNVRPDPVQAAMTFRGGTPCHSFFIPLFPSPFFSIDLHGRTLRHYDIIIGSLNWLAPVIH